jgi:hypothetical protein
VLYERLVVLSGHMKVWISYAKFEADPTVEEHEEDESTWKWVEGDLPVLPP